MLRSTTDHKLTVQRWTVNICAVMMPATVGDRSPGPEGARSLRADGDRTGGLELFRPERAVGHEETLDRAGRQRAREQVAQRMRAPEPLELACLRVVLDSFRDHTGVERAGEGQDA